MRPGNFSNHASLQPITCMTSVSAKNKDGDAVSSSDQLITGTVSGQLFLWVDRNCLKIVKAHEVSGMILIYVC